MTTIAIIPLTDDTLNARATALHLSREAAAAVKRDDEVFNRDWPAVRVATDAWRARNPGVYIAHADKDPAVIAASAEYRRVQALTGVAERVARDARLAFARLVLAQVEAAGKPKLPALTIEQTTKGFRYLLDGVLERMSQRAKPYTSAIVQLRAEVSEDGISNVRWEGVGELSINEHRLRSKARQFTPCVSNACLDRHKGMEQVATVLCRQDVVSTYWSA